MGLVYVNLKVGCLSFVLAGGDSIDPVGCGVCKMCLGCGVGFVVGGSFICKLVRNVIAHDSNTWIEV